MKNGSTVALIKTDDRIYNRIKH